MARRNEKGQQSPRPAEEGEGEGELHIFRASSVVSQLPEVCREQQPDATAARKADDRRHAHLDVPLIDCIRDERRHDLWQDTVDRCRSCIDQEVFIDH